MGPGAGVDGGDAPSVVTAMPVPSEPPTVTVGAMAVRAPVAVENSLAEIERPV